MIITFWVDEDRVNRYQKSRIVLLNDLSSMIYQLIYVQNVKPEERLWNIQLSTDNYNDGALPFLYHITSAIWILQNNTQFRNLNVKGLAIGS